MSRPTAPWSCPLVAGVLALALAGCGEPAQPTSLFVTIETAAAITAPPDELRISVYDDHGQLFTDRRLPGTGPLMPLSARSMGTVTVYVPSPTTSARIEVRGFEAVVMRAQGAVRAAVVAGRQVPITVTLEPRVLPDRDGDGVPDPIDNCPATVNADQLDGVGDGVGDLCRRGGADGGGTDGGVADDGGAAEAGGAIDAPRETVPEPGVDAGGVTDAAAEAPPDVPVTGLLSIAEAPVRAEVNLTAEGTTDWAHWGLTTALGVDRKASGGGRIKNITPDPERRRTDNAVTDVWSDGAPTVSARTATSVYSTGNDASFTLTVAADTTTRTLRLYVGANNVNTRLTARLSDGSAAEATYGTNGRANRGSYDLPLDITFRARSAGQTLTLTFESTTSIALNDYISLQAATLF